MNNELLLRPIDILPMPLPLIPLETSTFWCMYLTFILIGVLIGLAINKYTETKWQFSHVYNIVLPIMASVLLFSIYGSSMETVKGLIFFSLLLLASNSDIKTREVSNWYLLTIAILALVDTHMSELPFMLLSAILITLPQLLVAMVKEDSYGGADIKLMAACALLLGFDGAVFALIVGLSIGIITTIIKSKIESKKLNQSFPIVPYLSLGSIISYFIF